MEKIQVESLVHVAHPMFVRSVLLCMAWFRCCVASIAKYCWSFRIDIVSENGRSLVHLPH